MSFRKILCPVDFSQAAEDAARYASALANRYSAELTLLHVAPAVDIEFSMAVPAQRRLLELRNHHNRAARQSLELFAAGLEQIPNRELAEGDAAEEIVRVSRDGAYDLIVMPSHGAGAIRRWLLLGSVTTKVLHAAECPVLAAVDFGGSCFPANLKRVYCAIDLESQSERVLCFGAGFAKEMGAALTVVHAAPALGDAAAELGDEVHATLLDRVREKTCELLRKTGTAGDVVVESGKAYRVVANAVSNGGPGLVVIGRGVSEGMLGRLRAQAYEIIRHSPCPVLSV